MYTRRRVTNKTLPRKTNILTVAPFSLYTLDYRLLHAMRGVLQGQMYTVDAAGKKIYRAAALLTYAISVMYCLQQSKSGKQARRPSDIYEQVPIKRSSTNTRTHAHTLTRTST